MELYDQPAHELQHRLTLREISATDIVRAVLQRLGAVEGIPKYTQSSSADYRESPGSIHSYISLFEKDALAAAQRVDKLLASGLAPAEIGPLVGIPIAVKDVLCVKGYRATAASNILEPYVAPYSATSVSRLQEAGAIVIGKTNLDEFAFGSSTESSAFTPTTRNPWNPYHVPGGSSGGSAAAIAAGEAIMGLGSDTAGSIRQPAAFCGVVGLKPTYGRVSRYGLMALASSLDCVGPITKDVRDAALALTAISGFDGYDATSVITPVPDYLSFLNSDLRGMRVGIPVEYFDPKVCSVSDNIARTVRSCEQLFRDAGAQVIEVSLPSTHLAIPCYFVISRAEASSNLHRFDGVKYGYRPVLAHDDLESLQRLTRSRGFGPQAVLRILMGMYVLGIGYSDRYYRQALQVRRRIRDDFERALSKVDVLFAPTTPTTAFPLGDIYGDTVEMQYADRLTVPANHAGLPAISVPCGLDSAGLPIGLQLISGAFREDLLLRAAYAVEERLQFRAKPMAIERPRGPVAMQYTALPKRESELTLAEEDLGRLLNWARFDTAAIRTKVSTEAGRDYWLEQLNNQLGDVETLRELGRDQDAELATHGVDYEPPMVAPLRPDRVSLDRALAASLLMNAPLSDEGYIVVPPIPRVRRTYSFSRERSAEYDAVIGLEIHVQLATRSKLFCACRNSSDEPPNSLICPICTGQPGSLPRLNRTALDHACKLVAIFRRGELREDTVEASFSRKNYFYPDLPKGFQISAQRAPLVRGGTFPVLRDDGTSFVVQIAEMHLEEDAGKIKHEEDRWLLDFNRCGVPLVEVVTEPCIRSPQDAALAVAEVRRIVRYLGISDGNMEDGNLRCDANISVALRDTGLIPPKSESTEIKNLNSLDGIRRALMAEFHRQAEVRATGGAIVHETLAWNSDAEALESMRLKEQADDYRYFPEPDLIPRQVNVRTMARLERVYSETPLDRELRLMRDLNVGREQARVIVQQKWMADFFEESLGYVVDRGDASPRSMANVFVSDVVGAVRSAKGRRLTPSAFARIMGLLTQGRVSRDVVRQLVSRIVKTGESPEALIRAMGWEQLGDEAELRTVIRQLLSTDSEQITKSVKSYQAGKEEALGPLVGQVMSVTGHRASGKLVRALLKDELERLAAPSGL